MPLPMAETPLRPKKRKSRSGFKKGQSLHSLDELKKGDYVVHSLHGIGVFDGINKLEVGKITKIISKSSMQRATFCMSR